MRREETKESNGKALCYMCIGEAYLAAEIKKTGIKRKCSYCGRITKSIELNKLSIRIARAFNEHYIRTNDQPTDFELCLIADEELSYQWEREGDPIIDAITNASMIPEGAASEIQKILEEDHGFDESEIGVETDFSSGSYYIEKDASDSLWYEQWLHLEQTMKVEERYFNQFASDYLSTLFDGIDQMHTHDNNPLFIDAGPGTEVREFFRARTFQSDENLKFALARPDLHLGPPPSSLAINGRMNAPGISVFYGASNPETAVAEVRPPVGSQVAVARFEITRPIRLLNLAALGKVTIKGSIFDSTFIRQLERAKFLRALSRHLTQPVMPNDEASAYIATQAVSDFLATKADLQVDGILFPSVQTAGQAQNVVLFHKASRVELMEIPSGTVIDVSLNTSTEEGPEVDYTVFERVPKIIKRKAKANRFPTLYHSSSGIDQGLLNMRSENRAVTLRLSTNSVIIHIVKGVEFQTEQFPVNRHRFENRKPKY